jgi:hypothetical protein
MELNGKNLHGSVPPLAIRYLSLGIGQKPGCSLLEPPDFLLELFQPGTRFGHVAGLCGGFDLRGGFCEGARRNGEACALHAMSERGEQLVLAFSERLLHLAGVIAGGGAELGEES